ncbi:T-cell-interacting, activating receptor on myeloid cells protein 1 isoform X3 [Phyllostomus hastatus]|uniref:T-cell-interacting, activating receptor on myeloid cells protein 1 isoform X3 n=1 Tax=Phyllostomus hastatus TaxID=9423 RepID=UPI001E68466E|nr:T-cell-interacting, activating receptor on myeloid cells protein 1 isoform X3 [Phyllostomus hastatus]
MILPSLALFCVGLCVGLRDWITDESLPRPSISVWPSWVVPTHSKVTLQCSAPIKNVNFIFKKNNSTIQCLESSDTIETVTELHLTDLQNSDAGEYTCEYYRRQSPNKRSPPSDVLLLLVTGYLAKPSLQGHHRGNVTAGENMTLQCQKPSHVIESYMFVLLKKGTPTSIQLQNPVGEEPGFPLRSVTVSDTGNYSCVYYQKRAPFLASVPSDHFEIWVTDETESAKRTETLGAARNRATKCSHSSKNPEVVTDASTAIMSCSPALDEGSQESRAEELHGVMYAELNARALSEGPSNQMQQPLETCVYSTLKM